MRPCPFCASAQTRPFGRRGEARYTRCADCGSILMDLTPEAFSQLHAEAFVDDGFLDRAAAAHGQVPNHDLWRELDEVLPAGDVLEIGAGSGHALAAARDAGRHVTAVETSAVHREFIRRTWGIDDVHASLDELPAGRTFHAIFLVNVLEHVYDVAAFLAALRTRLAPGGALFLSTTNADCIVARVGGTAWSMFKQPDHVSFPSGEGLRRAAARAGFEPRRVWSGEMPLETPIGFAVAARDLVKERLLGRPVASGSHAPAGPASTSKPRTKLSTRAVHAAFRLARRTDWTAPLAGRLGVAATIKGLLT